MRKQRCDKLCELKLSLRENYFFKSTKSVFSLAHIEMFFNLLHTSTSSYVIFS